jgi:hypothetical protein
MEQVQPAVSSTDWSYAAGSGGITNTSDVAIKAAAGVGVKNVLTSLQVQNTHATVATEVVVKDGSTVIWRCDMPAVMKTPADIKFDPPLKSSANTALNVACITTGSKVYVNAQGFTKVA